MPIETLFMDECTLLTGPGRILGFTFDRSYQRLLQFMPVPARLFVTVHVLERCLTIHSSLSRTVGVGYGRVWERRRGHLDCSFGFGRICLLCSMISSELRSPVPIPATRVFVLCVNSFFGHGTCEVGVCWWLWATSLLPMRISVGLMCFAGPSMSHWQQEG